MQDSTRIRGKTKCLGTGGKNEKRIATCRASTENLQKEKQVATEQVSVALCACLAIAMVTAAEQSTLQQGRYVRLHGLNKKQYNGQEGVVVRCERDKAEVRLAELNREGNQVIKVHRKNLSVMPTFTTSRCKLKQHVVVDLTFYPEPVVGWPATLTGDYFAYLGVDRTASAEQIKLAYRNLSILLHPDKNPTRIQKATSLFKQVREAYDTLKDEQQRRRYLQELIIRDMMMRSQQRTNRNSSNSRGGDTYRN
jgi:hypothetical protein